ncbi:MAG: IS110 family transposase, partial [Chitinophagaceae bacterium]
GLAPREHTSGSSIKNKRGICKMGSGHLRSTLYMCAISAKKHNAACRDLYDRLRAAGKPAKLALIAVCNKLLKQAFAIATKGTKYQPDFKSSLA